MTSLATAKTHSATYALVSFENGKHGVTRNGSTIAAGMTQEQARSYLDRLTLRDAWGV